MVSISRPGGQYAFFVVVRKGQVHNAELAEIAEFFFREIKFRVLSLRYRAKNQNAKLAELVLNFIK